MDPPLLGAVVAAPGLGLWDVAVGKDTLDPCGLAIFLIRRHRIVGAWVIDNVLS